MAAAKALSKVASLAIIPDKQWLLRDLLINFSNKLQQMDLACKLNKLDVICTNWNQV